MDGRGRRAWRILAGALAALLAACRTSAGFARHVLEGLSVPAMARLHRLTASVPFPVAEPLALLLAAGVAFGALRALASAAARRSLAPLRRWLAAFCWAALMLLGALALLWEPARAIPREAAPVPGADRLEWLCGELIDALNASELRFSPAAESLRRAPEAAGMAGRAVKAARYPEWMRVAHLSGLFVPLTGEALADAGAPPALIPFTAVHELAHLAGIADEGAANVAAWEKCMAAGGEFADSARLWTLRYALGLLGQRDPVARARVQKRMKDALARALWESGGEAAPSSASPAPRLSLSCGEYEALVGYLIEEEVQLG